MHLLLGGCPSARTDEALRSGRRKAFHSEYRFPETDRAERCTQTAAQFPSGMDGGCGRRHSRGGGGNYTYVETRSGRDLAYRDHVFSEIADLHVSTLASSSPVDVISTDRHTVKPWFQGKIPFAFNLPELQNSEFTLIGGRMTYLDQTPGAHLIYDARSIIFPCSSFRNGHCHCHCHRHRHCHCHRNCQPVWIRILLRRSHCRSTRKRGVKAGFAIS